MSVIEIQIETLAYELKSLVGRGATIERVIMRPTLNQLVAARYPGNDDRDLGILIIKELKAALGQLPERKQSAANYLFKFVSTLNVYWRRAKAMQLLECWYAVDSWRRAPELDFMREIATVLVERLGE